MSLSDMCSWRFGVPSSVLRSTSAFSKTIAKWVKLVETHLTRLSWESTLRGCTNVGAPREGQAAAKAEVHSGEVEAGGRRDSEF